MLEFPVAPMRAKLGALPTDDEGWAYEIKWDGYRTLVFVEDGRVRLQSSSGRDVTDRWPEIGTIAASVNASRVILDGEMTVLDDAGRPRFELLQQAAAPAIFHAFDVLSIGQHDTVGLGYLDRRRLLGEVLEPGSNWRVPAHHLGGGAELLAATAAHGLEGIMAKRVDAIYRPGVRTDEWRKVKNRQQLEVVIGGYTTGTGNRAATFGSLLVGRVEGAVLRFAGGVGTGFTQDTLTELAAQLRELSTPTCPVDPLPPPRHRIGAHWVRPELTARIEIAEVTNQGQVRHATFLRLA